MPKFFDKDHPVAVIYLNTPAQFKTVGLDFLNLNSTTRRFYEDKDKDGVLTTQASDRDVKWRSNREQQVWRDVFRGMCFFPDDRRLFKYSEDSDGKCYRVYNDGKERRLVENERGESTREVVKSEIRKFFNNSAAIEKFFFINCFQGVFNGSSQVLWSNFLRPDSIMYYINDTRWLVPSDRLAYEENIFKNESGNVYTYIDNGLYLIIPLINGEAVMPSMNKDDNYELDAKINTKVRIQAIPAEEVDVSVQSCQLTVFKTVGISRIYTKLTRNNLPIIFNPHFLTPGLQFYVIEAIKKVLAPYDYSELRLPMGYDQQSEDAAAVLNHESVDVSLDRTRDKIKQDSIIKIKKILDNGFIDNTVIVQLIQLLRDLRNALPFSSDGAEYLNRHRIAIIVDILDIHKAYTIDRHPMDDKSKTQFQVYCDKLMHLGKILTQQTPVDDFDVKVGVINKNAYRSIDQEAAGVIVSACEEIKSNWKSWQEYQLKELSQAILTLRRQDPNPVKREGIAFDEELVIRYLKLGARALKVASFNTQAEELVEHCYVGLQEIFETQPDYDIARGKTQLSTRLLVCKRALAEREREIDDSIYTPDFLKDYAWYYFVSGKMTSFRVGLSNQWVLNTIANEVYILILRVIIERIDYLKSGSLLPFDYSHDLKLKIEVFKSSQALPKVIALIDAFSKESDIKLLTQYHIIAIFLLNINDCFNILLHPEDERVHKHSFPLPSATPEDQRAYLRHIQRANEQQLKDCRAHIQLNHRHLLDLGIESEMGLKRHEDIQQVFYRINIPEKNSKLYWSMMFKAYLAQKAKLDFEQHQADFNAKFKAQRIDPVITIPSVTGIAFYSQHLELLRKCTDENALRNYLREYKEIKDDGRVDDFAHHRNLAISLLVKQCQSRIEKCEFDRLYRSYCELYPSISDSSKEEVDSLFLTRDTKALDEGGSLCQSMLRRYRDLTVEEERRLLFLKEDRDIIKSEIERIQLELSEQDRMGIRRSSSVGIKPSRPSPSASMGRASPISISPLASLPPSQPSSGKSTPLRHKSPSGLPRASVTPLLSLPSKPRSSSISERFGEVSASPGQPAVTPSQAIGRQQASPRTPISLSASASISSSSARPTALTNGFHLQPVDSLEDRVRSKTANIRPASHFNFLFFVFNYREKAAQKRMTTTSFLGKFLRSPNKNGAQDAVVEDKITEQSIKSPLPDFRPDSM